MGLPFCRPDRFREVAWTLASGTPVTGFDVDRLTDQDPSYPLQIEEDAIALEGDAGEAVRVDGLAVIHHTLSEGVEARLRIHSAPSWGGAVDITVTVTVGAWQGRWAPHLYFNVAAAYPVVGDRTRQYFFLDASDEYGRPIQIGELLVVGQLDELELGMTPSLHRTREFGRSLAEGKKGPQYIHDRRTRDRRWQGRTALDETDIATLDGLWDQHYGVQNILLFPENDVTLEPIYGRFLSAVDDRTINTPVYHEAPLEFRELSCGEAY